MAHEGNSPGMGMDDEAMSKMHDDEPSEPHPDNESSEGEDTAFLPKSVTGGKQFNPGDEIVLKVVSVDENGDLEVQYASEGGVAKSYESEIDSMPG